MKTGQSKGWAVQASTGELVSGKNPHAKGSAEAEAYVESWRTACLDKAVQVRCGGVDGLGAAGPLMWGWLCVGVVGSKC